MYDDVYMVFAIAFALLIFLLVLSAFTHKKE